MNRSSLVKAIGCLTLASIAGCSSAAHSLGGDELRQKIDGAGGGAGDSTGSGGNSDAGVATAAKTPASDPGSSSSSCGTCADFTAPYAGSTFTFAGCCLPNGSCGVDVGVVAQYVHANVVTSPGANTEVRLSIPAGCQPLDQIGVPDITCPSMQVVNPNEFEGCCRSDGTCGANLGIIHAGCVQPAREQHIIGQSDDGGVPASPLPPQPCNYPN